jgi:hypothetical protein
MIALEQAIGFGVANGRLDGAASFEFAADGRRRDAAHAGDKDTGFALVAAIDISALDSTASQSPDLLDLARERVTVIGLPGSAKPIYTARHGEIMPALAISRNKRFAIPESDSETALLE